MMWGVWSVRRSTSAKRGIEREQTRTSQNSRQILACMLMIKTMVKNDQEGWLKVALIPRDRNQHGNPQ